ncbi:acyl-coenzyme A thioesterase 13 isoform X1 [Sarcophilus harrisii]|uniref:Acyl-coenzyme A thioesterase 13 n=1 Tax=Sarcophilus harrisii TaxID=9305 RepID=A0A7N4PTR7_SARHA|nr:acyl-coenzyme A thioesterase 13 isoform X1 [Sarcophilus harrisii]
MHPILRVHSAGEEQGLLSVFPPFHLPPSVSAGTGFAKSSFPSARGREAEQHLAMGPQALQNLREMMKFLVETRGFDRVMEKVNILSTSPGKVVCEMKVEEQHTNRMGTLHGGLTATLVDVVSTVALMNTESGKPGVSVDMNITYLSPAKIGEEILIAAHILKQGKTLAFASVDLTNKTTGKLVAQGRHTKHLGS